MVTYNSRGTLFTQYIFIKNKATTACSNIKTAEILNVCLLYITITLIFSVSHKTFIKRLCSAKLRLSESKCVIQ